MNVRRPKNSLDFYFTDIGEIKPLTKEEERKLFQQYYDGDVNAFNEIINKNLKLVVRIVKIYKDLGLPFEDLIAEGNLGLIEAVKRFDLKKDMKFTTYAKFWIKQKVFLALLTTDLIRIPIHIKQRLIKIFHEFKKLIFQYGQTKYREDFYLDISEQLGISVEVIENDLNLNFSYLSLDLPISISSNYEKIIIKRDIKETIHNLLEELSPREKAVLGLRYGIFNDDDGETLVQTSKISGLNLTRERIRQIEKRAKKKLLYKITNRKIEL